MSMNCITIHNAEDLAIILNHIFLITGDQRAQEVETESNMWAISLSADAHVAEQELLLFITSLLRIVRQQLITVPTQSTATFYMWFDEMAGQLRFNVISGRISTLPFGCTVVVKNSPQPIVQSFLASNYTQGIPFEECVIEDVMDDDACDDEDEYILPVYVEYLHGLNM